jgi:hypothetical protein
MRVGGQRQTPTALKKTRYPLCRRLGGPQSRSGRVRKISPPPGFDPRTVQPVASRYTDYDIPAHEEVRGDYKKGMVKTFMISTAQQMSLGLINQE